MSNWKTQIDLQIPCWKGYRGLLRRLSIESFPGTCALNSLLPREALSGGGEAIRFVPASTLPSVQYERHIFETGQVSTREDSWHDLFNALVWCRLPRLKSAMNSLHYENLGREKGGRRGKLRDALTLLDESGVIVCGSNPSLMEALAKRDWRTAFVTLRASWHKEMQLLICGHAILEKFLDPYKSLTAHALLLHTPDPLSVDHLDALLADSLCESRWVESTASLSPLPLMGIPGWWPGAERNPDFYEDRGVFRPAPERMTPAQVRRADTP